MAITDKWVDVVLGHPIEVEDSSAPDQCMDLAFSYCLYRKIPISAIRHQYAYQVVTLANSTTWQYFDSVPVGQMQNGDLVVWGQGVGAAGHIAIFESWVSSTFISIDQNWNGVQSAQRVHHALTNVIGALRPKQGEDMTVSKEEVEVIYMLAVPGQGLNPDFVAKYTGQSLDDVLHALQNDPSIQAYISSLLKPAAPGATVLAPGTYTVK